MEKQNYYVENRETDKLNIFTTKAFYDSLPEEQRAVFKKFCLWSRSIAGWVSKGKAGNCGYLKSKLEAMGFVSDGIVGERLAFAEQITREQEKAAARAERSIKRAEKAEEKSDALYNSAKEMASVIPFGQPILVGHHSEKRDRNYRDRIHNTFGKAFAEQDKAKYYTNKAENAQWTADGEKFKNPFYISKKVKETESLLRKLERYQKGNIYVHSTEREIGEERKKYLADRINEEQEKLAFYKKCLEKLVPNQQSEVKANKNKGNSHRL